MCDNPAGAEKEAGQEQWPWASGGTRPTPTRYSPVPDSQPLGAEVQSTTVHIPAATPPNSLSVEPRFFFCKSPQPTLHNEPGQSEDAEKSEMM